MPETSSTYEFVLDTVNQIRALICGDEDQIDQEAVRFDTLVGALRDLRGQWKDSVEVEAPATSLDDVDEVDAAPLADEDFDPFAEAEVEHIPNPRVEASLAHAERIRGALQCSNPACGCQRPDARVHCPVCGRLTLRAGMGAACEVGVVCCRLHRQRRKPCADKEVWRSLTERGLWDEALTKAAQAACRKIWVGPKPAEGEKHDGS